MKFLGWVLRFAGAMWVGRLALRLDGVENLAVLAFAIAVMAFIETLPDGENTDLQPGLDTTD